MWVGGKWTHVASLCLLQLRVHRGRPAPSGAGQAGEDGLLCAVHDWGGADAGVVPAQAVTLGNEQFSVRALLTRQQPSPLRSEKKKSNSQIRIIPDFMFEITLIKVTGHWFCTGTHSSHFKRAFCTLCCVV